MKWFIAAALWLLACIIALYILWRLQQGNKVVLNRKVTGRLLRMTVIILLLLGAGNESNELRAEEDDPPKTANNDQPFPLKDGMLEQWALKGTSNEWQLFKRNYIPARQLYDLIARLDANEQSIRQNALETIEKLPSYTRSILEKSLKNAKSEEQKRSLELLVSHARRGNRVLRGVETIIQDLDSAEVEGALSSKEILTALDAVESRGFIDEWVAAFFWRKTAKISDPEMLPTIFARLALHTKVTNCLTQSASEVTPAIESRAWASKAGTPNRVVLNLNDFIASVKKNYPAAGLGSWEKDAVCLLKSGENSGEFALIRAGEKVVIKPGEIFRFNRLDLLEISAGEKPAVVEHEWLGQLNLPAKGSLSCWDLPQCVSEKGKAALLKSTDAALKGDGGQADRVEQVLPLAYPTVRTRLAHLPTGEGAPRLRLIMSLFDGTSGEMP